MSSGVVWPALMVLALAGVWHRLPAGGFHKSPPGEGHQVVFYQEGNNGTVSVVQEASGRRWLLVDGQPVAGTGRTIVIDQKMLAHLPLLLHPAPRRALTVGFGSGGTSHSMTLHGIDVDCVEIERAVPSAADNFAVRKPRRSGHPHFHLIVDDARSWLRVAPVHYDVIATDCTNLQYKSSGDLYTVDYFRLMKERLTDHGLAAAWVPANGIDPDDLKTLFRSFQAVFPHTSVWFMNTLATDFLIVIGTPHQLAIDLDRLRGAWTSRRCIRTWRPSDWPIHAGCCTRAGRRRRAGRLPRSGAVEHRRSAGAVLFDLRGQLPFDHRGQPGRACSPVARILPAACGSRRRR